MASYDDYLKMMQNRPMPFYLNSETGEDTPGGRPLPYQTGMESEPYEQAAKIGNDLFKNMVDEISGEADRRRQLEKARMMLEGGTISQGNALDFNPVLKGVMEGTAEMTGIAPSARLMTGLSKLQSTVLRPQSAFEWADYGAGMASEAIQTGLAGVDLAAIAPIVGKRAATSLANEIGTFGGLQAKNPPLYKYDRATMAGKTPEELRELTGWHTGMEGKPRFEIDDRAMQLKQSDFKYRPESYDRNLMKLDEQWTADKSLSSIIDHPELFNQYPELKDVNVKLSISPKMYDEMRGGSFNSESNTITVNASSFDSAKDTLTHEIQHWIQQKEGFARGGSPENAPVLDMDAISKIRTEKSQLNIDPYKIMNKKAGGYPLQDYEIERLKKWEELTAKEDELLSQRLQPFEAYQRLAGEIEARDAANRRTWPMEIRRAVAPDLRKDAIIRMEGGPAAQVSSKEVYAWERSHYFKGENEKIASSREVPMGKYPWKEGTWRVDEHFGPYGRQAEQLRKVKIEDLKLSEEDYTKVNYEGRGFDADRYSTWIKEGKDAPPINVIEADDGSLLVSDGHRRLAAAKKAGISEITAWVSPRMDTGKLSYEGNPIYTAATIEGLEHGAKRAQQMYEKKQAKLINKFK